MTLITYLTRVHFADNVLEDAIRLELETAGIRRPLVAGDGAAQRPELTDRLLAALPIEVDATLHGATAGVLTEADARIALALYRQNACDGLIAFGCGAVIDFAKAIRVLVAHDGPLARYAVCEGGSGRIRPERLPPMIAVPTTAGSGSEAGPEATLLGEDGRQLTLFSRALIPTAAICDPTLTLSLPPTATAETGMEALTHCIETFIAASYNPPADGIAYDGVSRAAHSLEGAVLRGDDLTARREMMAAALNGALAFQKGLGAVHASSHALASETAGASTGPSHGALNAVMLPHVLAFNAPAVGERVAALGRALRLPSGSDVPEALATLNDRLGLPAGLGAMGVTPGAIERAAPLAERDRHNSTNPRRARAADYARLMRAAL
ncbi:MAG: iron-containing alcohol dehydrogenase [Pseudomonadota bacterium]